MSHTTHTTSIVVRRALRVPRVEGHTGDGSAVARQLDAALIDAGFKLSRELLEHLSQFDPETLVPLARTIIDAARELVGDHVRHNAYFIDFPANVPDTLDFWISCVADALQRPESADAVYDDLTLGAVNLLNLPTYGRYQHTYEELLAAHDQFIPLVKDRLTVLHLGEDLATELRSLYLSLATSTIVLGPDDQALLRTLAASHAVEASTADNLPMVREHRAIVNAALIAGGRKPLVDTTTDVLRLAVELSGGDVSLRTNTRLVSFKRPLRRTLLRALDEVVEQNPSKLSDVPRYREQFKRLGKGLHPYEHKLPHAQSVFEVARGDRKAQSLMGRVEAALNQGSVDDAVALLSAAPGLLVRSVDRLLRLGADPARLAQALTSAVGQTATSTLLSLREHLSNRGEPLPSRVFTNQEGRSWATEDTRSTLDDDAVAPLNTVLDGELAKRLRRGNLVIDPAALGLALPKSDKNKPSGVGIMPRGSRMPVGDHVRFFVYWRQADRRTDYDLSVQALKSDFTSAGYVSFTNLTGGGMTHSGDIVEAPHGASEFIDIDLGSVKGDYLVPQVLVYSGENFDTAAEAFFGYMDITPEQKGMPFEAQTVQAKSDLSGSGRIALPLVFIREDDGSWSAQWMHMNMRGNPRYNQVEGNSASTGELIRALVNRSYLRVSYLDQLLREHGEVVDHWPVAADQPITFLGLTRPEDLPAGSAVYTPSNLHELLSSA